MNPFFTILTIATKAVAAGLDVYARKFPKDTATINRARYCVACLEATTAGKPLPRL
jgi:hypothetical protein